MEPDDDDVEAMPRREPGFGQAAVAKEGTEKGRATVGATKSLAVGMDALKDLAKGDASTLKDLAQPLQDQLGNFDVDEVQGKIKDEFKGVIGAENDADEYAARKLLAVQVVIGIICLILAIIASVLSGKSSFNAQLLGAPASRLGGDRPTLVYLDAMGHSEVIKLAFFYGGIPFEFKTVDDAGSWGALLHEKHKDFPSDFWAKANNVLRETAITKDGASAVPALTHGDFRLAGALACAQYAADLGMNKLHQPTAQQRAFDSMIVSAHIELIDMLEGDKPGDAGKTDFCDKLGLVDSIYKDACGLSGKAVDAQTYLYGRHPSLGDLAMFSVLTMGPPKWHVPTAYECFDPTLAKWSNLKRMFEAINASTKLQPYLTARRKWLAAKNR